MLFEDIQSQESYARDEELFKRSFYDVHRDFQSYIKIDGYKQKLLVVTHGLSTTTLTRTIWFWLFSLMGLTVPYRWYFSRHCLTAEVTLTKSITL